MARFFLRRGSHSFRRGQTALKERTPQPSCDFQNSLKKKKNPPDSGARAATARATSLRRLKKPAGMFHFAPLTSPGFCGHDSSARSSGKQTYSFPGSTGGSEREGSGCARGGKLATSATALFQRGPALRVSVALGCTSPWVSGTTSLVVKVGCPRRHCSCRSSCSRLPRDTWGSAVAVVITPPAVYHVPPR